MRRIAVIGSGIVGLLAAHGLLRAGYAVTLYSDRTGDDWLTRSKPTGTAARFDMALDYERELGLNFWDEVSVKGQGVDLAFCPTPLNQLVTLRGRFSRPFMAVDLRLQCQRWLEEFEIRGGRLVIEAVTVEGLDSIAAQHDLTLVAAGRAELSRLFERDANRSVYDKPQRHLAMIIVKNASMRLAGVPFLPVKFNLLATDGEAFWVPYFHKDAGPTWNLVLEAKPGGRMDRFGAVKSGDEAVAVAQGIVKDLFPWDYAWAKDWELADEHGWLVGRLPSGRLVMALGDTAMSLDPIAGQGANNGSKMARRVVQRIIAHGDHAFDTAWMTETFEAYYAWQGRWCYDFTNIFLEPLTPAGQELLIAQYGSDGREGNRSGAQKIANAFCDNFNDPSSLTTLLTDMAQARAFIAQMTGQPWWVSAARGCFAVVRNQVCQRLQGSDKPTFWQRQPYPLREEPQM